MARDDRTRQPTLREVAESAGVSLATAARTMRMQQTVDPVLADRVRKAAVDLGYVPNALARTLRGGGRPMVGLVIGDMLDPYFAEIAEAVTLRAESRHSMMAIVSNMQRDPLLELDHCQRLFEHRVAGLILAGGGFDQLTHFTDFKSLVERIQASGVIVTSLSPRDVDVPTFAPDNKSAGSLMARHLIESGHRNIGVLMGPKQSNTTRARLEGVQDELDRAGIRATVQHGPVTGDSAECVARDMLQRDGSITGFIVGADSMAVGVLRSLSRMGKRVPDDCSVIGLGNTQLARFSSPRLTTVSVDLARQASDALDYIAARVAGAPFEPQANVAPELIEGESVTPPRPIAD